MLLLLTCLGFVFFMLKGQILVYAILAIIIAFQVASFIHFLNRTNRKMIFFFDAIENSDSTIHFTETEGSSVTSELNKRMNQVNHIIQNEKIKTQTQEQYYQTILEYTNVGIMTVNKKGHVLFANQTVKAILGCEVLTHIQQLSKVASDLHTLIAHFTPFDQRLISLHNERETITLSIAAKSIKIQESVVLVVSIQNIYNELDTQQVDSWMGLIKVLSHEIMNSLAPITSISQSLSKVLDTGAKITSSDGAKLAKGLSVIQEQSLGLTEFVSAYRAFTKIPKPDKELIPIASLFDKIVLLVREDLTLAAIKVEINLTPNHLEVFADEPQLTQMILNLVKNAIQSLQPHPNGILQLEALKTVSNRIIISVIDNGAGIPEALIDQIFIPFFTTKEKGTGIGLSLSKHIMQQHQGHITVKSIPHRQTIFSLAFPGFSD